MLKVETLFRLCSYSKDSKFEGLLFSYNKWCFASCIWSWHCKHTEIFFTDITWVCTYNALVLVNYFVNSLAVIVLVYLFCTWLLWTSYLEILSNHWADEVECMYTYLLVLCWQYSSFVFVSVLKDVPYIPSDSCGGLRQRDNLRLLVFPNLNYSGLYQTVQNIIEIVRLVQNGQHGEYLNLSSQYILGC